MPALPCEGQVWRLEMRVIVTGLLQEFGQIARWGFQSVVIYSRLFRKQGHQLHCPCSPTLETVMLHTDFVRTDALIHEKAAQA